MITIPQNHQRKFPDAEDWISESINGGSLRHVDLQTGTNGWASPPGDLFSIRSKNYFTKRQKSPAGDYLLFPAGMDWLKSTSKLENVLAREDNRVSLSLLRAQAEGKSLKSFIFAVNLQIPSNIDQYSAVFYFATEDPIPTGSLLHRFIHEDDTFRNERFKIVNRIVNGPWIVKKTVGNYSACLLGKALACSYHKGTNYFEIDVDIGSSALACAILRLTLLYVNSVTIDMGFLVEAVTEDELPERLIGAVRVSQIEMEAAAVVESVTGPPRPLENGKVDQLLKSSNDDSEEKICDTINEILRIEDSANVIKA
ncbi:Protein ENHANCED DISEASE RESISTANCE 2-like protein, partial [Cucurbita argyrosperma subsp. argyrosperma]